MTVETALEVAAGIPISTGVRVYQLSVLLSDKYSNELTLKSLDEKVTIFRNFKSSDLRSQNLYSETFENSHLFKLNTDVESGLSSEGEEYTIRLLLLENVGDVLGGDRKDCSRVQVSTGGSQFSVEIARSLTVDFGSHLVRSLNGSDVGVDENSFNVGFLHSFDRLSTCLNEGSG